MAEGFPDWRPRPPRLDGTDAALPAALQEDGRARLEDLARLVGLSASSVHDRLRRLRRDGVIRRWTVELDPAALGLGVLAFVGVRASRPCGDLVGPLAALPEVEEYHAVAGGFGALLKVRAASPEHLHALLERLRRIPGGRGHRDHDGAQDLRRARAAADRGSVAPSSRSRLCSSGKTCDYDVVWWPCPCGSRAPADRRRRPAPLLGRRYERRTSRARALDRAGLPARRRGRTPRAPFTTSPGGGGGRSGSTPA